MEHFFTILAIISGALVVGLVIVAVVISWRVEWVSGELLSLYEKIDP